MLAANLDNNIPFLWTGFITSSCGGDFNTLEARVVIVAVLIEVLEAEPVAKVVITGVVAEFVAIEVVEVEAEVVAVEVEAIELEVMKVVDDNVVAIAVGEQVEVVAQLAELIAEESEVVAV